jgi:hypothetical protein
MSRLPQPGGDLDSWGTILNDYLSVSIESTGALKAAAVATAGAGTFTTPTDVDDAVADAVADHAADIDDPHAGAGYAIMVGGGRKLFVQSTDPALVPANNVQNGDVWVDIA